MPKNPTTILALDPGLRDLGFAVLDRKRLLTSGVRPLRLLPTSRRALEARNLIRGWITAYGPGTLVLESTYPHPVAEPNALDRLARSARRIGRREHVKRAAYAPQTVRKTIVGNGRATKHGTAVAVAQRFPALRVFLTADRRWKERHFRNMFDAVALALHHQAQLRLPPSHSRSFD